MNALEGSHWSAAAPNTGYRSDYHTSFIDRCLGEGGQWNLYQWKLDASQKKPGQRFVIHHKKSDIPAMLWNQDGRDIELLLSPLGVGVLSIALTADEGRKPRPGHYSLSEIKTFNYSLAHRPRQWKPVAKLTKADGAGYGELQWEDWLRELLQPLSGLGITTTCEPPHVIPYTVVRFGKDVAFSSLQRPADVAEEDDLAGQASLLAQADEASHPLPIREDQGTLVRVFHTDELFAVSSMGAATLVCDIGIQFDEQKVQNRLDVYFLCFLTALMQRLQLLRLLDEAVLVARCHEEENRDVRLVDLRTAMLSTVSRSDLIEVSARDSVNRYLRLCQEAQRVPDALALVQQTLADLDASLQGERQGASLLGLMKTQTALHSLAIEQGRLSSSQMLIAQEQVKHSRRMAATQNKVEWIEIFLISFYSAELVDLIGQQFHMTHEYLRVCVLLAAFLGGVIAAMLVKPWAEEENKTAQKATWPPLRFAVAVFSLAAIVAVFVQLGMSYGPAKDEAKELRLELQKTRVELNNLASRLEKAVAAAAPPAPTQTIGKAAPRKQRR